MKGEKNKSYTEYEFLLVKVRFAINTLNFQEIFIRYSTTFS